MYIETFVIDETYTRILRELHLEMTQLLLPIENAIGWIIAWIYAIIPNVGVAIIIVTLLVMLLIFPLTHKQTKSTLAMQALQPKIKELQKLYKDDRQKLSEEQMALYKEAGVNPLGGCLPTLIQMPFLFSIFRVVKNIQNYVDPSSSLNPKPQLFHDLCSPVKTAELCTASASKLQDAGYGKVQSIVLADKLPVGKEFLGLQLQKSFWMIRDQGFSAIFPYIVLVVLLAVTSYISMSRQQRINPNTPSQMKFLKYIFPFGIAVSGVILPAGSNLYILTSSTWRACQQEFLYRRIILPHREKGNGTEKSGTQSDKAQATDASDSNYQPGLARQKRKKK